MDCPRRQECDPRDGRRAAPCVPSRAQPLPWEPRERQPGLVKVPAQSLPMRDSEATSVVPDFQLRSPNPRGLDGARASCGPRLARGAGVERVLPVGRLRVVSPAEVRAAYFGAKSFRAFNAYERSSNR